MTFDNVIGLYLKDLIYFTTVGCQPCGQKFSNKNYKLIKRSNQKEDKNWKEKYKKVKKIFLKKFVNPLTVYLDHDLDNSLFSHIDRHFIKK